MADPETPRRRAQRPLLLAAAVLLGVVAMALFIVLALTPDVWTDDAPVEVHAAAIAPHITGQGVAVPVDDKRTVATGERLLQAARPIMQCPPVKILVSPGQRRAGLRRAGVPVKTTLDTRLADVIGAQANRPGRVTTGTSDVRCEG